MVHGPYVLSRASLLAVDFVQLPQLKWSFQRQDDLSSATALLPSSDLGLRTAYLQTSTSLLIQVRSNAR